MCDCMGKEGENMGGTDHPETITLFAKCPRSYHPRNDTIKLSLSDTVLHQSSRKTEFLPCSLKNATCDASKHSLYETETSTESSRTYKFVSPRECDCLGEPEEEKELELPPIHIKPCSGRKESLNELKIECTLAIIKPEAVIYREQIEQRIFEEGFEVYQTRWLQLTLEQVSEFYLDKYGQLNFAHLVIYMASGPIIVYVLAKQNAVADWKTLIGPAKVVEARLYFPDSIRARYGRKGEDFKNAVHGSATLDEAEREIHFFFPEMIIEPLLRAGAVEDYLRTVINPILLEALSLCCKLKPADPVLWLANWLILNNPNKPKLPEELALIPP